MERLLTWKPSTSSMRLEKWLAVSVGAHTPHLTNFQNPKSCHLQVGYRML